MHSHGKTPVGGWAERALTPQQSISLPAGEGGPCWREGKPEEDRVPPGKGTQGTAPEHADPGPSTLAAAMLVVPRGQARSHALTRGVQDPARLPVEQTLGTHEHPEGSREASVNKSSNKRP